MLLVDLKNPIYVDAIHSGNMLRKLFSTNLKKHGVEFQHQLWINPCIARFSVNSSGKKKSEDTEVYIEGFKSLWRKPLQERDSFWTSQLEFFRKTVFPAKLLRYSAENWKYLSFQDWRKRVANQKLIEDQRHIEKRLEILGHDLAAAHFVVYRGGAVKFYNTDWIKDDKSKSDYDDDLPNTYNSEYILEAIDFSGTNIVYEGLKNIENLSGLKGLSFSLCFYFDDWCLDRISGEYGENLEFLDISLTNVSHHGLHALYRFRKLKTLKVRTISDDVDFALVCLEIKKCRPELVIEGLEDLTDELDVKQFLNNTQG